MPTSACCRPDSARGLLRAPAAAGSRGFTLLEVLLVVALMGLLTSLVVPNLQRVVAGLESATRRDGVLSDVNLLGYRAHALGQSFELSATTAGQLLRDGSPVLPLPEGWRLEAESPIHYSASGFCEGGALQLKPPGAAPLRLVLESPLCRVRPRASS